MPRKTDKQKEVEGTGRKDRGGFIPGVEKIPAPSKSLPKEARAYYDHFAQHLLENSALQSGDRLVLERAAKCALMLDKAETEMNKEGAIQTYKTGNRNVSPEFTVFMKMEDRFLSYCSLLGISPKSRHLMAASFVKKEEGKADPFRAIMGGSKPDAA